MAGNSWGGGCRIKLQPRLKILLRNQETNDISEKRLKRKSKEEKLLRGTTIEAKMWVSRKFLKPITPHEVQWDDKGRLERPVLAVHTS